MDEQTRKRIEELERINREQAAQIAALKAEAEKPAPKFKVGDTAYIKVTITEPKDEDGDYEVKLGDDDYGAFTREADLLPAAPALVPVVPGELKPGDEVYVKATVRRTWSDGDVSFYTIYRTFDGIQHDDDEVRLSIPANVYQVR